MEAWNEANLSAFLTPQIAAGKPVSADHYRLMLNAFYEGVHAVQPSTLGGRRLALADRQRRRQQGQPSDRPARVPARLPLLKKKGLKPLNCAVQGEVRRAQPPPDQRRSRRSRRGRRRRRGDRRDGDDREDAPRGRDRPDRAAGRPAPGLEHRVLVALATRRKKGKKIPSLNAAGRLHPRGALPELEGPGRAGDALPGGRRQRASLPVGGLLRERQAEEVADRLPFPAGRRPQVEEEGADLGPSAGQRARSRSRSRRARAASRRSRQSGSIRRTCSRLTAKLKGKGKLRAKLGKQQEPHLEAAARSSFTGRGPHRRQRPDPAGRRRVTRSKGRNPRDRINLHSPSAADLRGLAGRARSLRGGRRRGRRGLLDQLRAARLGLRSRRSPCSKSSFPAQSGDGVQVVCTPPTAGSPIRRSCRAMWRRSLGAIAAVDGVVGDRVPTREDCSAPPARSISDDGTIALATAQLEQRSFDVSDATVDGMLAAAGSAPSERAAGRARRRRDPRQPAGRSEHRRAGRPLRRDHRPVDHLRLGGRDGAADPHGDDRPRRRPQPRDADDPSDRHGRLLPAARRDDRPRRRHRLRAVRGHPVPLRPPGRARTRRCGRGRDGHRRPGGAVRRGDRLRRPARAVRDRRRLPLRAGASRLADGAGDNGRRADPAARPAEQGRRGGSTG